VATAPTPFALLRREQRLQAWTFLLRCYKRPAPGSPSVRNGSDGCRRLCAALPFRSNTFDIVIAVAALCFSADPLSAIRETARVLRPGGSLVIGELGKYSCWAVFRRIRALLGSKPWSTARFWSMGELQQLVETSGLGVYAGHSCVYYPPFAFLAKLLSPFDSFLSHAGQYGAAFIAVRAVKPARTKAALAATDTQAKPP
jgi:SAM-dependent methyltransferase